VCAVAARAEEVMRFVLFELDASNSGANSAQAEQLNMKQHPQCIVA